MTRQLGADVAVADDAERAAAHLVGALGGLVPHAVVHQRVLLRQPPGERDDLGDRQLDDGAGVGERRVEHRDAAPGRGGQVDLVRADAERADGEQVGRGLEHALGDMGLGADAKQADAPELLDELVLAEGARHRLYLIASLRQSSRRVRVNVLQQQGTVERVQRQHLFPTLLN